MQVFPSDISPAAHALYSAFDGTVEITVRRHSGKQGFCSVAITVTRPDDPIEVRSKSFYDTDEPNYAERLKQMDAWIATQLTEISKAAPQESAIQFERWYR